MRRLILYLLLGLGLGLAVWPAQAQQGFDADLAQAAAENFLITLTTPTLSDTISFYTTAAAQADPLLADLQAAAYQAYEVTQVERLEPNLYQVEAALQPGQESLRLRLRKTKFRWQVASLELFTPSPEQTGAATAALAPPASEFKGTLVFQTRSGGDIYAIEADGHNLRHITTGIDPALSPDGATVAFTRWDGAEFGVVYTIELDGTGERAVLSGSRQAKSPTWSPDGRYLVFSFQQGGRRELLEKCRQFDFDDGIRLPNDRKLEIGKVHVGEDSLDICYKLHPDLQWRLRRVDLVADQFEDMPSDLYSFGPTWHPTSPDQWIYKGELGLVLYDHRLGRSWGIGGNFQDHTPVISPDGTRIAVSYYQHDHWEIHTMNIDGSNRQRLTDTPLAVLAQQDNIEQREIDGALRYVPTETRHWNHAAPTWSPDGRRIAFLTDRTGRWEIWVMEADGANPRPMFAPGVLDHLTLEYAGVDERMLSWRLCPGECG